MRFPQLTAAVLVAASVMLALAGCVQQPPKVIPTTQPTVAPVFATDADALAAAKKAYEGYLAASDAIGNDGGKNPERIAEWVTKSRLSEETKEFEQFQQSGDRTTGSSSYSHLALQQREQNARGVVSVSVYLCDDVSKSRLLDARGRDITLKSRQDVIPLQVSFESSSPSTSTLLVEGSDPWSGTDFCSPPS